MPFNIYIQVRAPKIDADEKIFLYYIISYAKEQSNNTVTYFVVTYFLPDTRKAGGRYVTVSGNVRMLDGIEHAIIMADRTKIPIEDVRYIEGDLFRGFEF